MELKGLDKITSILQDFADKQFYPGYIEFKAGTDFSYEFMDEVISYAVVTPERDSKEFEEVCHTINPYVKADIFLLSIFHELGHHSTWDDLSDADLRESDIIKNRCAREMYYWAPDEYAATEWGLDYIESHASIIKKLWEELQPAIQEFYKINNITKED